MEEAREGTVLIGDRHPEELGKECFPAAFFYLLQEDPAFDLTPEEMYDSVEEGLAGQGLDRERLRRNAERLGADSALLRERKISQMSQGERKKVFLALAFALSPRLLLLDEPTNHLDGAGKAALLELLKERRGGAVIITHDELFDGLEGCRFRLREGRLYHE
jgi:ATPase subunit of ABC transporter with duplicated ATPase domains